MLLMFSWMMLSILLDELILVMNSVFRSILPLVLTFHHLL